MILASASICQIESMTKTAGTFHVPSHAADYTWKLFSDVTMAHRKSNATIDFEALVPYFSEPKEIVVQKRNRPRSVRRLWIHSNFVVSVAGHPVAVKPNTELLLVTE